MSHVRLPTDSPRSHNILSRNELPNIYHSKYTEWSKIIWNVKRVEYKEAFVVFFFIFHNVLTIHVHWGKMCNSFSFVAKIPDQNGFLEQFLTKIQFFHHNILLYRKPNVWFLWGACHYSVIDAKHWGCWYFIWYQCLDKTRCNIG